MQANQAPIISKVPSMCSPQYISSGPHQRVRILCIDLQGTRPHAKTRTPSNPQRRVCVCMCVCKRATNQHFCNTREHTNISEGSRNEGEGGRGRPSQCMKHLSTVY